MLHLLTCQLRHLHDAMARRVPPDRDTRADIGAMTTLELVVLAVGVVAIAALFLTAVREAVNGRLDLLK